MKRLAVAVLLAASVAACAAHQPPPELRDARAAYAHAHAGAAAQANTVGLHEARRALDEAERKFADDPTAPEARDLAYIAQRKALLAEANARATIASTQRAQAEQALAEIHARAKLEEPPARATDASERKARVAAPSQDSRE